MTRPPPRSPALRPALVLALLLSGVPGVAKAQLAETMCATAACLGASTFCLAPDIAGPFSPFGSLGLLFEPRRGGMRFSAGILHHAPLGFVVEGDAMLGTTGSTVVQGSLLGRWTVFREGFGGNWALKWEPGSQVPDGGGLQGVLRFGVTGRIGDRGVVPRALGHVGLALEWIAMPPMGIAFTAGALVPVGAGMLSQTEAPIPYFSIDLMLLMGDMGGVGGNLCDLDVAPPPPPPPGRGGGTTNPAPVPRPVPSRPPPASSTSGSCGGDDCFGPGCGECGSCAGPAAPPPVRKPVIAPK